MVACELNSGSSIEYYLRLSRPGMVHSSGVRFLWLDPIRPVAERLRNRETRRFQTADLGDFVPCNQRHEKPVENKFNLDLTYLNDIN